MFICISDELDGMLASECCTLHTFRTMPSSSPVALILGAGANIGQTVARTFASKGYKVALAARSLNEADSTDNQLNITSDFSKSDDVVNAFNKSREAFGIPGVVVYNGKAAHSSSPLNPAEERSQRIDDDST